MVGGYESARSLVHLAEMFRLADKANLFTDPDFSVGRMKNILALGGVENG